MKIVYIILAHKLPEQLVRLVRRLNTDLAACFLIHVDKKTNIETYNRMVNPLDAYENVHFLTRRHVRYYGDYNHLSATLDGFQQIVSLDIKYDYVMLLTGQDYPIKSNEYIKQFLQEAQGNSFIEYFQLPSEHWKEENGGMDRVNHLHFNLYGYHFSLHKENQFIPRILKPLWSGLAEISPIKRKVPANLKTFFGGNAYWCLSRDCAEYVYDFVQKNNTYVKFFENVNIPEEIFFQTVLQNSPFNSRLVNDSLRHIDWSDSRHPAVLRKQDFKRFMSTDKPFARKFDVTLDEDVLDMIDQATS